LRILLGLGYAQVFAAFCVVSYYCALMALTLYYLAMSFQAELPWSICRPEWRNYCISATSNSSIAEGRNVTVQSSAELYFRFEIIVLVESTDELKLFFCSSVSFLFLLFFFSFLRDDRAFPLMRLSGR
jgi:solute carrier family 6 amino acid transporter-like protein 5/7/9/14